MKCFTWKVPFTYFLTNGNVLFNTWNSNEPTDIELSVWVSLFAKSSSLHRTIPNTTFHEYARLLQSAKLYSIPNCTTISAVLSQNTLTAWITRIDVVPKTSAKVECLIVYKVTTLAHVYVCVSLTFGTAYWALEKNLTKMQFL